MENNWNVVTRFKHIFEFKAFLGFCYKWLNEKIVEPPDKGPYKLPVDDDLLRITKFL